MNISVSARTCWVLSLCLFGSLGQAGEHRSRRPVVHQAASPDQQLPLPSRLLDPAAETEMKYRSAAAAATVVVVGLEQQRPGEDRPVPLTPKHKSPKNHKKNHVEHI